MKKIFIALTLIAASFQVSAQCNLFYDGFESGSLLPHWQFGTGTYTRNVITTTPAVGTYSFEHTGSSGFYEGTYATFSAGQPNYISFWMRTNTTNGANGYVVIGDTNIISDNGILFCYFNGSSELRFYGSTGQNFPINANQWYHVEAQNINWTARTMDIYLDGNLILTGWPFRSTTANSIDRIHFHSLSAATAMYDEILIGNTPLTGTVNNTICNNDSMIVNGTTYNAGNPTGTEIFTNIGPNMCDSTVTVNLTVLPTKTGSVTTTICNNGNVIVNGTTYNAGNPSGTEVISNVGPNMCDSTVTVSLTVLAALTGSVTTTICNEDTVLVNGNPYYAGNPSGTEVFTNVGPNMCDSTVTVNLTLNTVDVSITSASPMFTSNATTATYQWVDCNNNFAAISGETNASFTATANGDYAVIVTQNGCTDTSACVIVTGVGINENNSLSGVNIYPNPANNVINVSLGDVTTAVNFTLTSIDGKVVYQANNINDNNAVIDISNNAKGVYFLRIETNNQHNVYKVIKQ